MQDSKRATTQKRKDQRSEQNRSNATATRLTMLTVGVVYAVVLSNQLYQVPVTDIDIWWNKLQKRTIHSKLRSIDTFCRCLLLSKNIFTPVKLSISNKGCTLRCLKKEFTLGTYRWVLEYHYGTLAIFQYNDSLKALYIETIWLHWHWSDNQNSSWCWNDTKETKIQQIQSKLNMMQSK